MTILVIGGCHTYGYGLSENQSFVDHFTEKVKQKGYPATLTCYAFVDLHQATTLIATLPLDQYDLILLQLGNYRLQHPAGFTSLLTRTKQQSERPAKSFAPLRADDVIRLRKTPVVLQPDTCLSVTKRLKTTVKLGLLYGLSVTHTLPRLQEVESGVTDLLTRLQPHRERTILLTPFPHLDPVSQFLRQRGRQLFLRKGRQHGFSVFDTDQLIRPYPLYFLANDPAHLNAVSHELLGKYLYAFYETHVVPKPTSVRSDEPITQQTIDYQAAV